MNTVFEKTKSVEIFSNQLVTVYKTVTEKDGDIYTAISGGSHILWSDYSLEGVIDFLFEKTATISKEEAGILNLGPR